VLFIAMRYVQGGDVGSLVHRSGALPAGRVAAIVSPIASALDSAHAAGLVHRDVKPANMLLDARTGRPDHVYLSDFGLSKEALGSAGLTGSGQFLGTVDYVAPEQIQGLPATGRIDQYALGCSAFEMLCGEPPFRRDKGLVTIHAHLSDPPPRVTSRRAGLPAEADEVFLRVLAKAPEDRYGSCREFSNALRTALGLAPYDTSPGHPATEIAAAPAAAGLAGTQSVAALLADHGRGGYGAPASLTDPAPAHPPGAAGGGPRGGRRTGWLVATAAVASALAAAAVVLGLPALTRHSPGRAAPPRHTPAAVSSPRPSSRGTQAATAATSSSAATSAPAPAGQASAPAAASSSSAPAPATTSAPPAAGGPANIWMAQLASIPLSDTARLQRTLARIRLEIPGAQVLDSSDYASLVGGYWVIYYAGAFSNGTQALTYCAAHGRSTRELCIGRFLSHSAGDFSYQCYPPASSPQASCDRP
jgi:serine/threonine-protein kinase